MSLVSVARGLSDAIHDGVLVLQLWLLILDLAEGRASGSKLDLLLPEPDGPVFLLLIVSERLHQLGHQGHAVQEQHLGLDLHLLVRNHGASPQNFDPLEQLAFQVALNDHDALVENHRVFEEVPVIVHVVVELGGAARDDVSKVAMP